MMSQRLPQCAFCTIPAKENIRVLYLTALEVIISTSVFALQICFALRVLFLELLKFCHGAKCVYFISFCFFFSNFESVVICHNINK